MFIAPCFKPLLVTAALLMAIVVLPVSVFVSFSPPTLTLKKSLPSVPVGAVSVTPYDVPVVSVNLPPYVNDICGSAPENVKEFPLVAFVITPP